MNYSDYVTEYLGAGLLFTFSLVLFLFELSGAAFPYNDLNSTGLSIASFPGAILLLFCVLISYPIGYLLFMWSLKLMIVFGRKKIYIEETKILNYRPYCDIISQIEHESQYGYAGETKFEKTFALVRLYMIGHHRETFTMLSAYWTRLSRMFGSLALSFLLSSLLFLVLGLRAIFRCISTPVSHYALYIFMVFFVLAITSGFAYNLALRKEIRYFVAVALSFWGSSTNTNRKLFMFAYGSNMLTSRITKRAPSAVKLCVGQLTGYKLIFNKKGKDGSAKANLEYTKESSDYVYGVLFQLDLADLTTLDAEEPNYERHRVLIQTVTGPGVMADIYLAWPEAVHDNILPFDWYIKLVVLGAKEHNLPEDYRAAIESTPVMNDKEA